MQRRCTWAKGPFNEYYHDTEWGKPCFDDHFLFELLILEGMQAGLSWETILKKREAMQLAFDQFDVLKVSQYDETKIEALMQNKQLIRNRRKIQSAIQNATCFVQVQQEWGSFYAYLWHFTDGKQIVNAFDDPSDVPTQNELSLRISKDLKKRGFSFVGPTIIYSYLEAVGIINDHMTWCKEYHTCILSNGK